MLDHVLCDPSMARAFDQYVLTMLPDRPSSLMIRWFALRIRKRFGENAKASASLDTVIEMARSRKDPFGLVLSKVPPEPGIYWLTGDKKNLYVGETKNLRERLEMQFDGSCGFEFWNIPRNQLQISFKSDTNPVARLPIQQSRWISDWNPIGNFEPQAARQ